MKRSAVFFATLLLLAGCHHSNAPDVSGIQVNLQVERFDRFLFSKLDTGNARRAFSQLQSAYPYFADDFITNILSLPTARPPYADSLSAGTFSELKRFIRLTRPLFDSLSGTFDEAAATKELTLSFKYLKYYYPAYPLPRIVAYLGPFDAPGIAVTNHAVAIGLQLFGGKDFSFYNNEAGIALYPSYISRRFEQPYIPAGVMMAVVQDMYPDRSTGRPLVEQMIEKGKQWYLLDKFLPDVADSLKTGYTAQQLRWCSGNEGLIWNFFRESNDLYTTEPSFVQNYIGEAPSTPGMPPSSPGNIGQWLGWQIVQAYADKHPVPPDSLMRTEAKKIFAESKYKPRYK